MGKTTKSSKKFYKKNKEKILKQQKRYYELNKKEKLEKAKEYRQKNKKKIANYQKTYRKKNKKKAQAYSKTYRKEQGEKLLTKKRVARWENREQDIKKKREAWKNMPKKQKEKILAKNRENRKRLQLEQRLEVLNHYCNGKPRCMCKGCPLGKGKVDLRFLTMEHINGRMDKNKKTGHALIREILLLDFPKDITVHCWNCNCAKGFYGICPHISGEIT